MKLFAIIKTGYSVGIYGNSGEYFTLIIVNDNGLTSDVFSGQYGAEQRVAGAMKDRGYTQAYVYANYGKCTRKDIVKGTKSEYQMIEDIKGDTNL